MILKLNDINYYVNVHGKGFPLLLLHGFTGSSENWHPFIKFWEHSFQLIMVDIIGHGKTESPDNAKRYSMDYVTDDLLELLNKLDLDKINLLGYSMGGRLALSFAIKYPNRVHRLILESTSPGLQSLNERKERMIRDEKLAERIMSQGIEAFVDYWEAIPLFASQNKLSKEKKTALKKQRLCNSTIGLANSLRGMGTGIQPSWWEHLADLNIPTLLLVGELDKKYCQIARLMCNKLPNSELKVIKNTGHNVHLEEPQIFSQIVLHYLLN
ncbi:MAG: 2-succinyl-6-hydroxy-2,4-cyclohexadiene-carboxylate synthase [Clostridia bacterium]|nr:2-succinyl-6-hydroxy-2,4-cyclohexadiene-carboxylate synthase [Clostridia bacterium]